MAPRISIVLPVFNGAAALPRTVESLLGQTEEDFELIAVDDGSTDATGRILVEYAARDQRIRVLNQANAGITRALIRGCAEATAPLIARQDCGDLSRPERLRRMTELFEARSCVAASCEVAFEGPDGEPLHTTTHAAKEARALLRHAGIRDIASLPHHGAAVMRADAYRRAGGYRAEFYFAQDLDLWIRMAALGEICVVDEVLYEARFSLRAISSVHRAEQIACARIAIAARDASTPRERAELLRRASTIRPRRRALTRRIEANALYFIAASLRKRNDSRWRVYAKRAVRHYLLHLRSWLLLLRG